MVSILLILMLAHADESLKDWRLEKTTPIAADLHHVQGIDIEGNILWVSSVDAKAGKGYLSRLDLSTGRLLSQVEVQQGKRIHPGGIALDGDSIWIPVAEYDRDGPTTIERRDKNSLALQSSFEVEDHIGCIAADDNHLIGGSWSSRVLYRWSKDGKQSHKLANPSATAWQDLKMDGNSLIGSGLVERGKGAVEWLSVPDFKLQRRILTYATDRGLAFAHEGMTYRGGKLYFLPEDAPSRLFSFGR